LKPTIKKLMIPLLVLAFTLETAIAEETSRGKSPAFTSAAQTVLSGAPVDLQMTNLEPHARVNITAERVFYGKLYRSTATFKAAAGGSLNLASAEPISAPWTGVDRRGLFWSMTRTDEEPPEGWDWQEVYLSADLDADGSADASTMITLALGSDDLEEIALGSDFPGAFFLRPTGAQPLPAVVVLGGSEGGDSAARVIAPKLASREYCVVGRPYYSPGYYGRKRQFPTLPPAFHNIAIDQLELLRDWLHQRDDVIADRIGVFGVSKGTELALAGASLIDGFAAIVAYVPSDVIWEGWGPGTTEGQSSCFSWRGEPLPFVPCVGMREEIAKLIKGEPARIRTPQDAGRAAYPDRIPAARIRVEEIDEPIFIVGGDADDIWDSGGMARNILAKRDECGLTTVAIIDPEAGHGLSGDGYSPTDAAEARVQGHAFPAMLAFLKRRLKP